MQNTNPAIHEKRREERVLVAHAAEVRSVKGATRDISASGVFLFIDATFVVGEMIDFAIEFSRQGTSFILNCIGKIIRVETREGKVGVAIKFSRSVMRSA